MTAAISLPAFHQWLIAEPSRHTPVRTIVLHGDSGVFSEGLIEQIADYLNEYDDDEAGCWLGATPDLVQQISVDHHLRKRLGVDDGCQNCPATSPCGIRKTLVALGSRGHVILQNLADSKKGLDLPFAFHAGIGSATELTQNCHLVLNPTLMDPDSLAHLIGDVFLEWLHQEFHRMVPVTVGEE